MKTVKVAICIYAITLTSIFVGAKVAAEELPQEMVIKTDVGEVVLKTNACKVDNNRGFIYKAYATDGAVVHNGCWFKDHDIVNILFYDEPVKLVASFKDYLFKARMQSHSVTTK